MPIYSFRNTKDGTEFDEVIEDIDKYLEENPDLEHIITKFPGIVSGVNFNKKQDGGWKENLSRIAEAHPNSPFGHRYGKKSGKEIKTRNIARKHGFLK